MNRCPPSGTPAPPVLLALLMLVCELRPTLLRYVFAPAPANEHLLLGEPLEIP